MQITSAATAPAPVPQEQTSCPNCRQVVLAEYCPACGQRRLHEEEWSLRHWAQHLSDEVLNLDSKILRTVWGLFTKPGALTREWLDGRRIRYVNPLRVYLTATAIFFLLSGFINFNIETNIKSDPRGALARAVARRAERAGVSQQVYMARYDEVFKQTYAVSAGLSVLVFAAVLKLLYRKRRLWYGQHLVFSLHYVSLVFAAFVVYALLARAALGDASVKATFGLYLFLIPYLWLALRRAYGDSAKGAAVRTVSALAVSAVVDSVLALLAMAVTFRIA